VLSALGVTREGFPATTGQARLAGAISVVLALGAISSAIITGALEEEEGEEAAAGEPEKAPAGEEQQAPAGEEQQPPAGGRELSLSADPGGDLRFDKKALESSAGRVTIAMKNPSSIPHNVSLEGGGVDEHGKTVEKDGTSSVSAMVKAGRYVFYCSVPGHRQAGMEGTLTVK
jgi:plastocyanin